jgi:phospholipid/cholesterol/gamma-HCH transport system substrate-binding protein
MAEKKHNFTHFEILSGLMVVLSAAALAGFIALISGMRPEQEAVTYYASFTNIIGLNSGADIRFGGIIAGEVVAIEPNPEDQTQIRVEAAVYPHIPVNAKSVATIAQNTLTSDKHLEISTGEKDARRLKPWENMEAVTKSGAFVDIPDLGGVIGQVEELLGDLRSFVGVPAAERLAEEGVEEFVSLNRIAKNVSVALEEGKGLITNVNSVLDERKPDIEAILGGVADIEKSALDLVDGLKGVLEENREPLNNTLGGVENIVKDVGEAVERLKASLDGILASLEGALENTEGLTGNVQDFFAGNRPGIEQIVGDLRETIRNLKEFSRTMSDQPNAVIWGQAPEGRK